MCVCVFFFTRVCRYTGTYLSMPVAEDKIRWGVVLCRVYLVVCVCDSEGWMRERWDGFEDLFAMYILTMHIYIISVEEYFRFRSFFY